MIRVNELLKREIGLLLYRIVDDDRCDLSAVTVTHVMTAPDLHQAKVLVSVRGDETLKEQVMRFFRRKRPEIQHELSRKVPLKYTPRLTFELDPSLELGDHVLDVLQHLDTEKPPTGETNDENETERPL